MVVNKIKLKDFENCLLKIPLLTFTFKTALKLKPLSYLENFALVCVFLKISQGDDNQIHFFESCGQ
jgi:hypothetical protein